MRWTSLLAAVLFLGACSQGGSDRDRAIARCERTAARASASGVTVTTMCTCFVDRLAAEGMSITDTIGSGRARGQEIMRSCAAAAGVSVPN